MHCSTGTVLLLQTRHPTHERKDVYFLVLSQQGLRNCRRTIQPHVWHTVFSPGRSRNQRPNRLPKLPVMKKINPKLGVTWFVVEDAEAVPSTIEPVWLLADTGLLQFLAKLQCMFHRLPCVPHGSAVLLAPPAGCKCPIRTLLGETK